jgi:hypothetical protein
MATSQSIAMGERLRHLDTSSVAAMKSRLRMRLSRMEVALPSALDLRDPDQLGISPDVLLGDDYGEAQQIAAEAYAAGLAGLLVPTATALGVADGDFNVIVFFEITGQGRGVYGMSTPVTVPRSGTTVRVLGMEELNLPP